jgi:glycosyltransferase involved in cell wall biosynthesis
MKERASGNGLKKTVMLMIPTLQYGGAERVFTTLLKYLNRERYRIVLVVVNLTEGTFKDDVPSHVIVENINKKRLLAAVPKILSLIWKYQPAVILSTLSHMNLALTILKALMPLGTRLLVRETTMISRSQMSKRSKILFRALMKTFYRTSDKIIAQSNEMRNDLAKYLGLPATKLIVIYNPVDVDEISAASRKYRAADNRKPGRMEIVAVGRLVDVKRHDLLIRAIGIIKQKDIHLTIVGDGPNRSKLESLIDEIELRSKVTLVGQQSSAIPYLAKADLFVLTSLYEGLPNVVLESLACGTPVVATPCPGGLNEILDGIQECKIAESQTVEALAIVIAQQLDHAEKRTDAKHIARFRAQNIARQYEELFS